MATEVPVVGASAISISKGEEPKVEDFTQEGVDVSNGSVAASATASEAAESAAERRKRKKQKLRQEQQQWALGRQKQRERQQERNGERETGHTLVYCAGMCLLRYSIRSSMLPHVAYKPV